MKKSCTLFSLVILLVFSSRSLFAQVDSAVIEAQNRRIAVVEKVAPSVVAIFSAGGNGGGSGVLISSDGYALTNYHVSSSAGTFMKCGLSDGHLYDAVIVGIDPTGDVALVKLLGRDNFPFSPMGDSDKLQIGDWSFAMGNPFLLATDFKTTVTYGIVSGTHRYQYPAGRNFLEYTDCIQIDTSINPGNSGGPLFNDAGELVGINGRGSFEKRGRVNSGAGYAISINQIKNFMDHLKSGRIVDHATLGASVSTREDGAVVVQSILEESEAARRGLEEGDEIISFAGRPIRSVNQYKNILGIYPKGWKIPLVYRRGGEKKEISVRLRALHRSSDFQSTKKKKKVKKKRPRIPLPRKSPKAKPPAKYKHMFVKKSGFANFYFNNLQKKRVMDRLSKLGDYSKTKGAWKLLGKADKGGAFIVNVSDAQSQLTIGGKNYLQKISGVDPRDDLAFEERYPGSGGLVLAMYNLRLFLNGSGKLVKENTNGKTGLFTSLIYLGSEPMDGQFQNSVDVLVSDFISEKGSKAVCRWYFNKTDGTLLGFDTSLGRDKDECQIRFDGFQEIDGRKFPKIMKVRHANRNVATLQIESVELATGS